MNNIFVVTAPSGAGKTSLVGAVIEQMGAGSRAVSHTTRVPRKGEKDGEHYYFVEEEAFSNLKKTMFATTVYHGKSYGTTRAEVERLLPHGPVFLIMDYEGAIQTRDEYPKSTSIFILPDNKDTLRERLSARGDMAPQDIDQRLSKYYEEISNANQFDWMVMNEDFTTAVNTIQKIVED